ncbi:MotA/TolQ/ExbB proton channel family protein [bacterium]|nr:MotA/TolQ/ExbB proton channel family protein [bacterium]
MDIATIVGLLGAAILIALPMIAGGDPTAFFDVASVQIVIGGSIMVVLLRSSLGEFKNAIKVAGKVFSNKLETPESLITQLVEFATIARKDGMIALEGQEMANPFLAKAIAMLVDGAEEDMIRKSLARDIEIMKLRHKQGASIFSSWGEVAPAMGMIGTLVGLVNMLGNMSDPKSIGPAMAIALLTTMYGAILANVFCIPISMKLINQSEIEASNCDLIVEGTLFIQAGGNPRILTDLLISFVPPSKRTELTEAT